MKKPIKSYTETHTHNGEKLEITIDVYGSPVTKNEANTFYTHIKILKHKDLWGQLFLVEPVEDDHYETTMKDVIKNIDSFKTNNHESNQQQFSQN